MKINYTICLLFFMAHCCFANVWQGDYLIESQADADAFIKDCNCKSITGNLFISGDDLVHLDSLYTLVDIDGYVEVFNTKLTKFSVFENLKQCEGFRIRQNYSLKLIEASDNLTQIDRFGLWGNRNLEQVTGFNNIETLKSSFKIIDNENLQIIDGFKALKKIYFNCQIEDTEQLLSITGFDQLEEVSGTFSVWLPSSIKQKTYFTNLTTVGENFISNISNFKKLNYVKNFEINNDYYDTDTLIGPSGIQRIEQLVIANNKKLKHIGGFKDLEQVDMFSIRDNPNLLNTLTGPSGIKYIGLLKVAHNEFLKCINGFSSLKQVHSININNNSSLLKIEGFDQLDFVGINDIEFSNHTYFPPLSIYNNRNLRTIEGFKKLKKLNAGLVISGNSKLSSMPAFDGIDTVVGQCSLFLPDTFLVQPYLKNLKSVGGWLRTNLANFNQLEHIGHLIFDDRQKDTLSGFETVKTIGFIEVVSTTNLKHIEGFSALEKVSTISINSNQHLEIIRGFDQLHTIESDLSVLYNSSLKEVSGFNNLRIVNGQINFSSNPAIVSLNLLEQLIRTSYLSISATDQLQKITGLENLKFAEEIYISGNSNLLQLPEFSNLTATKKIQITRNTNLLKVKGFQNLEHADMIEFNRNNNLVSIEGFNQLNKLSDLKIENRNLRKLDAFTNIKVLNNLALKNNIQLRSIDNFSSMGFIAEAFVLTGNLQLNKCCLIDCWFKDKVISRDRMNVEIYSNGAECIGSAETIKILCEENSCSEFEEKLSDLKVQNIANEMLQFSFIALEEKDIPYKIYNINEQLINKGLVTSKRGFNTKTINLPNAQKGFYFLQIDDENANEVVQFLKLD